MNKSMPCDKIVVTAARVMLALGSKLFPPTPEIKPRFFITDTAPCAQVAMELWSANPVLVAEVL